MEGFDLISTGVWSIIPPILALGLALITKEVYSSLAIGVFVGMVIYQFSLNGVGVEPLVDSFTMVPQMMAEQIAGNGALLLFLALLGALVVVIAAAGGSRAYAEWVSTHIKNAKMAQILTAVLGIIIFVDDYFNCLTVGAVMRPVTDRFNISHEKLAWIIDSTAAPICIIAPVSSWAVAVGGYLGEGGFTTFVQSIPYNFYALLTIVFVFFMCATKKDFGPMRVAEAEVQKPADQQHRIPSKDSALESMSTVGISDPNAADALPAKLDTIVAEEDELDEAAKVAVEEFKGMAISDKGRVFDLIIPIIVLIIFSILGMLYAGGFFQGVDFATAVGENPVFGLCIGVGLALLPVVIFVVAAFIGFAMGTSWGTIALILPIVIGVFPAQDPLFLVAIGATLGGAVYGDHVSPISDTTILSSAGAQCNHLRHVATQLPYASVVAAVCLVGYIIAGFTGNPWIALVVGAVLMIAAVLVLNRSKYGAVKA